MSKDIRSFFSVVSKKPVENPRKRTIVLDSSDDEVIEASPIQVKNKISSKSKKRKVIDSDSEDESKKGKANKKDEKKENSMKIKKVNAIDIFENVPIKQTKVEKKTEQNISKGALKKSTNKAESTEIEKRKKHDIKKKSPNGKESKLQSQPKLETELKIHDDPDFEKSLLELDNDLLLDSITTLDKTIEDTLNNTDISISSSEKGHNTSKHQTKIKDDEDMGIDKDQERYEKRRQSVVLYQKYLNRSGPIHHGTKEYPKGKADCLKDLCFLRTGVLDSLEDDEFQVLIKDHGGRTVHSVSKKVNYIVVGVDPGPAKLEKARSYGIPNISEDELLDMILTKSGMAPKFVQGTSSDTFIEQAVTISPDAVETKIASPKLPAEKKILRYEEIHKINLSNTVKDENINKSPKLAERLKVNSQNDKEMSNCAKEENIALKGNLSWADKYKPKDIKSIIGQQGEKSNVKKLLYWLNKWYENHFGKNKPKFIKPNPFNKNNDGANFKCALLSGPPGIGKTTTATLVAQELGFDIVEFNASDTRSKKLLHEEVSQLLNTNSLASFMKDGSAPTRKHILLMDEVDGMAGNEDRGGMQELIQLIKNTSIPIICMCNDRNHPKVRSLANYCFDLRFSKPRLEQIRGAMMSICFKENLKIKPDALSQIITGTGMDVRQTLNHLSMWTVNNKTLSVQEAQKEATSAKKDTILGPWEVIKKVFSEEEHRTMTIAEKFRLFFYDYSIGPLFVQENYLQVQPHCPKDFFLQRAASTAEAISRNDIVDKKMRSSNNWSLLEIQAVYSSVLPGHYMEGHFKDQINFPAWLGKNSKKGKFKRLIGELQAHMRICTSGSRKSINLDYIYHLRNAIIQPLINDGTSGIEKSLNVLHSYNLLREDLDSIIEVSHWPRQKDPMAMVDSKVKAALTRAYNKHVTKLPYSISSTTVKKISSKASLDDDAYGEEEADLSLEEDDDIMNDAMIKAKKRPLKTKTSTESTSSKRTASSSRGKGSKRIK